MAMGNYFMDPAVAGGVAGLLAVGLVMVFIMAVLILVLYIYGAITMMLTAKRLKTEPSWLAWIPVGNMVLLSKMAKMPWWPVLLLIGAFLPVLGVFFAVAFYVFQVIWLWKVCEARNKEGWYAALTIVPFIGWLWGLVLWGILAWGD